MAHIEPKDPEGLPEMILNQKGTLTQEKWLKVISHDKRARINRRLADTRLLLKNVKTMKTFTDPDPAMPDKPYWLSLRIHAARTAGFDLSDIAIKKDIANACDNNDDEFFRVLAEQLSDPNRPNKGVIKYTNQLERKWIIDNWVRLHYCDSSLPGLCWFTVPAIVRWLGEVARETDRGCVAYSVGSYNNALAEMGLRSDGVAIRECRISRFVKEAKLRECSVQF